ncbi:MAG: hypothetical protein ABI597_08670 [Gammaproteobacteria bacterium]
MFRSKKVIVWNGIVQLTEALKALLAFDTQNDPESLTIKNEERNKLKKIMLSARKEYPELLIYFLEKIAASYLAHSPSLVSEVLTLFVQAGFLSITPLSVFNEQSKDTILLNRRNNEIRTRLDQIARVQRSLGLITQLLATLQLLDANQSSRKIILSFFKDSFSAFTTGTIVKMPSVSESEFKHEETSDQITLDPEVKYPFIMDLLAVLHGHSTGASEKNQLLLASNWSSCINDYYSAFNFALDDCQFIFLQLQQYTILPTHVYLIELIAHLELFKQHNNFDRKKLIEKFFDTHSDLHKNEAYLIELFKSLYQLWDRHKYFTENELGAVVNDILTMLFTRVEEDADNLIKKQLVNIAIITLLIFIDEKSDSEQLSARNILSLKTVLFMLLTKTDSLFSALPNGNLSLFQRVLRLFEQSQKLLPQSSELTPQVTTDNKLFYQKNCALNNSSQLANFLALNKHEIPSLSQNQTTPDEKQAFPESLANLTDKTIVVYQKQYDKKNHTISLVETFRLEQESSEGSQSESIALFCPHKIEGQSNKDARYDLLVPAEEIIARNHFTALSSKDAKIKAKKREYRETNQLKVQMLLNQTLQFICHLADFANYRDVAYFKDVAEIILRHSDPNQEHCSPVVIQLSENLLGEISYLAEEKRFSEAKSDEDFVMPAEESEHRMNAFFRQLGCFANYQLDKQTFLQTVISRLPQTHLIAGSIYFKLFMRGIDPVYYETHRQDITLKFIDNKHFLELYRNYIQFPSDSSDIRFINLVYHPTHKRHNLLTTRTLQLFAQIEQHLASEIFNNHHTQRQRTIFDTVQSILAYYWDGSHNLVNSQEAYWLQSLNQISSILERLTSAYIHPVSLQSYFDKMLATSRTTPTESWGFLTILDHLRRHYPTVEDFTDQDFIDRLLAEAKIDELETFIIGITCSPRTSFLTEDKLARVGFKKLLIFINSNFYRDKKFAIFIDRFIASGIDLNKSFADENCSWLQFSCEQKPPLMDITHQLIQAGHIDDCAPFVNHQASSFINFYYKSIFKNPSLLNQLAYQKLFAFYMNDTKITRQTALIESLNKLLPAQATSHSEEKVENSSPFFVAIIFNLSEHLDNFAIKLILAGRLDLLKAFNECYAARRFNTDCWLTTDYHELKNTFIAAFHQFTGCAFTPAEILDFLRRDGFFTTYANIITTWANNYSTYSRVPAPTYQTVLPVLSTVNHIKYTKEQGLQFLAAYDVMATWGATEGNDTSYQLISNLFMKCGFRLLSLEEITHIMHNVAVLKPAAAVLDLFNEKIAQIFIKERSYSAYNNDLENLHTFIRTYEISQTPVDEVENQFKEYKNSFNSLLVGHGLFASPSNDPINYFFKTYKTVKAILTEDRRLNNRPPLNDILKNYHGSKPGSFNQHGDTEFFTALCRITDITLGMIPYHAQFATIMGTHYVLPIWKRMLARIPTGQGKTIILAAEAACIIKMGTLKENLKPVTFMPILTLTNELASQNAAETKPFFNAISVRSGDDVSNQELIVRYTTKDDLLRYLGILDYSVAIAQNRFPDTSGWVLMLDETDLALRENRLQTLSPFSSQHSVYPEATAFLSRIWHYIHTIEDYSDIIDRAFNSSTYRSMPKDLREHFATNIHSVIRQASRISLERSRKDMTNQGRWIRFEKETGFTSSTSIRAFGEPQFIQLAKTGAITTPYKLSYHCLYYSDAFNRFPLAFGVSGTLGSDKEMNQYVDDGYQTVETARFNAANLKREKTLLRDGYEAWANELIEKIIEHTVKRGVPLPIFLERYEDVKKLYAYITSKPKLACYLNKLDGTESAPEREQILKKVTKGFCASILPLEVGRGFDYKLYNKIINDKGGMGVIIGFPTATLNTDLQIEGRTARGPNNGFSIRIYELGKCISVMANYGILAPITEENIDAKMIEMWQADSNRKVQSLSEHKRNNLEYRITQDFYDYLDTTPRDTYNRKCQMRWFQLRFNAYFDSNKVDSQAVINDYESSVGRKLK